MLSEKEYLLLCEFIGKCSIQIETDSLGSIAKSLLLTKEYSANLVVMDMAENSRLDLKVKNTKRESKVTIYIIPDICGDTCIVCDTKEHEYNTMTSEENNNLIEFIRNNVSGRTVIIATGLGGIYAGILAGQLNMEGIVFGAPSTYELPGNIKNYIGENEPVGESIEKVIFLKQKLPDDNIYETLYETLLFDENGNVIICEQSDYSKFISWFYNSASQIDNEVWKIFFKGGNDDNILSDNGLLSIYLRIDELNIEGMQNSLKNTIKYIENELNKNMDKIFDKNILKLPYKDFEEQICKFARRASLNASEIIKVIFDSTQTILMGISVFALQKNYNTNELMKKFSESIEEILQLQSKRIVIFLENQKRLYIESLTNLPELFQINN